MEYKRKILLYKYISLNPKNKSVTGARNIEVTK